MKTKNIDSTTAFLRQVKPAVKMIRKIENTYKRHTRRPRGYVVTYRVGTIADTVCIIWRVISRTRGRSYGSDDRDYGAGNYAAYVPAPEHIIAQVSERKTSADRLLFIESLLNAPRNKK